MRKSYLMMAAAITLAVSSCTKKPVTEQRPDPEPSSAFTRTITYTNRGTVDEALYDAPSKMEARAVAENNELIFAFDAGARTPGSEGDAIAFRLDTNPLQGSPVKIYRFNASEDAIRYSRYTYTYQNPEGGIRGSITDSDMGIRFEGFLKVEKWDAERKLISGTYEAEVKGLISDPVKGRAAGPIDPVDQCDVRITGSFSNVKVQNL